MTRFDVVVIGAGTAGLAAYRAAAARTPRVLLVERGLGGTTCARVGCMPSKLLVAAADAAQTARHASGFGVRAEVTVDGAAVMERVRRERDRFVQFALEGMPPDVARGRARLVAAEGMPPDVARGRARLVAADVVDIDGRRVEAGAVVIATGSSPFVPPVFDGVRDRIVVNDDVFEWRDLPRSVVVFGTGVVGLELGQALHRLGVRVRVLGKDGRVGPLTDPAVRDAAAAALASELRIDFDATPPRLEPSDDGGILVDGERFDTALVAAGRRPNLVGLGLDAVSPGTPCADRATLRWAKTPVFIAGDANGELPLLHEAFDEGRIAGENAARLALGEPVVPGSRRSPLAITFCDPELAIAGSTCAELTATGEPFVAGAVDFADQGRSRVMRQNRGAARVYADPRTGRFLGAEMAGPRAENIGHLLAWAHQEGLTVDEMLAMPFYHPVVEEGIRTALRDARSRIPKTVQH